jgi:hypothetical protein
MYYLFILKIAVQCEFGEHLNFPDSYLAGNFIFGFSKNVYLAGTFIFAVFLKMYIWREPSFSRFF